MTILCSSSISCIKSVIQMKIIIISISISIESLYVKTGWSYPELSYE